MCRTAHESKATAIKGLWTPQTDGTDSLEVQQVETLGWEPSCQCNGEIQPATVLDPFAGSGTTLAVAQELGKWGIGTDLNPEYLDLAKERINKTNGITLPMMV